MHLAALGLRALLVAQRRLADLAELDETLVAITAQRAAEANDLALEIAALSVLASRREAEARADTLVLVAALERKRGDQKAAEAALHWALEAAPKHALARSELENALWRDDRFLELIASLGAPWRSPFGTAWSTRKPRSRRLVVWLGILKLPVCGLIPHRSSR